MAKAIAFMLLLYFGLAMCVGILAGGGGYAVTALTAGVDDDDVTLEVTSTSGFLSADYIELGGEKTLYTGKTATTFTGCTRGYEGTTAEAHPVGTAVYTTSASVINSALGFNIAATVDTMGLWSIVSMPTKFLFHTLPNLILMPYQLFRGNLIIFAVILLLIQVAIVVTLAFSFIGARRV
jgi:hypothetical protein